MIGPSSGCPKTSISAAASKKWQWSQEFRYATTPSKRFSFEQVSSHSAGNRLQIILNKSKARRQRVFYWRQAQPPRRLAFLTGMASINF